MGLDKVYDVPVFHSFRDNREKQRRQRDTDKRQNVLVPKPLPPNNLFDEVLRV